MLRTAHLFAAATLGLGTLGLAGVACEATPETSQSSAPSASPAADATGAKDVIDTAVAAGKFNTLAAALKAAGLVETLKGDGPFTVFAPTDDAFAKLPAGTVETLLKPENKEKLVAVLTYHVVPGKAMSRDLKDGQSVTTVSRKDVTVKVRGGDVTVGDAKVITPDVAASNGVIHVIDTVLLP
jgi:uncharacterized surface protein with fasciclin (FAS1) repeats